MEINKEVYSENRRKKRFSIIGVLVCANCVWWLSKSPYEKGMCGRYPKKEITIFEEVCGEHSDLHYKDNPPPEVK